jgi:hypothetical protein
VKPVRQLCVLAAALALCAGADAAGNYKDWIGYSALRAELGEALPTGRGVRVTQVEVLFGEDGQQGWAPDGSLPAFERVKLLLPGFPSGHANSVARHFYGSSSMAPGVAEVECYPNTLWAYEPVGVLRAGSRLPPAVSRSAVANHSWNAKGGHEPNRDVLERVDFLVAVDDFIQVGGANNQPQVPDVLQCSYNAIVVGRSSGHHSRGTNDLGQSVYVEGRSKPDIVAPARHTSTSSPMVASAAAMLVGFARGAGSEISAGHYTGPRTGRRIYHAESSEVIKAALMAGADRSTSDPPRRLGRLRHYREERQWQTDNGLDARYGAGQLNVRNSYHILAGGEHDSAQDAGGGAGGGVPAAGFDYDPAFGGLAGSNRLGTYVLTAPEGDPRLKACLAWNLRVESGDEEWSGEATLYDLDLKLYDVAWSGERPVARSVSSLDNTENIWHHLVPGRRYELRVVAARKQAPFLWDYGLAWQIEDAPGGP